MLVWPSSSLHQTVAFVWLCFWYALRNAFAVVACFSAGGILFQHSCTLCEKEFFLTYRRGAGICRFSGSAAALVTLSISFAILNHVSLFTLSFPTRILWTCCMSSWCLHSTTVVCPSSLRRSSLTLAASPCQHSHCPPLNLLLAFFVCLCPRGPCLHRKF
jgi:hypothetical protein